MTKQLLIALLITGLSATAKAEPTVYYCNTTHYAQVNPDQLLNLRSYPVKLFVDIKSERVKVSLTDWATTFKNDEILYFGDSEGSESFQGSNRYGLVRFYNKTLAYTDIDYREKDGAVMISSFTASCDKF